MGMGVRVRRIMARGGRKMSKQFIVILKIRIVCF